MNEAPEDQPKPDKVLPLLRSAWWETYLIRYFVGTVVGAIVLLVLARKSEWGDLLPEKIKFEVTEITYGKVLVLAVGGLAYCYVASAPILALHSLRGELGYKATAKARVTMYTIVLGLAIAGYVWASQTLLGELPLPARWFQPASVSLMFIALVVSLQTVAFGFGAKRGLAGVKQYYFEVTNARAHDSDAIRQYIESYRVMREHGNAFLTVVLEISLGATLVALRQPGFQALAVLLWCAPAGLVWVVGSFLESRLPEFSEQQKKGR